MKNNLTFVLSSFLAGFYLSAYLAVWDEWLASGSDVFGTISICVLLRGSLFAGLIFASFKLFFSTRMKGFRNFLFRHRIAVGIVLIGICTLFSVSGTSINCWASYLGGDITEGTIFGFPRSIRSDEWMVNTPFAISQEYSHYSSVSNILRGTSTDVTLVYAQPCWAFSTLFRPFLWGYLFFGSARGLAFFWSARLIVLLLVSIEFGLLWAKKNKTLSCAYALLIVFSPVVQWWFAVNGIAELLIFGQGLVLSLNNFLKAKSLRTLALHCALMAWLSTGFILVLYPAWQVPLFWIFATLGISLICVNGEIFKDKGRLKKLLLCALVVMVLISVNCSISILCAQDAFTTVLNTVYPGERNDYGGGLGSTGIFVNGIFGSINAGSQPGNACEAAGFFGFTPMGLVLGLIYVFCYWKNTRRVEISILLLCVLEVFLLWYSYIGFSEIVAKLTLLSHSTSSRTAQMVGMIDVLVFIKLLSAYNKKTLQPRLALEQIKSCSLALFGCIGCLVAYCFFLKVTGTSLRMLFWIFLGALLLCFLLIFVLYIMDMQREAWATSLCFALVVATAGMTVNPIQKGIDALTNNKLYNSIEAQVEESTGELWASSSSLLGQLCISAGAPTINSVNTYPVLDRWEMIDSELNYLDVYNRYARISIGLGDTTRFELVQPDSFLVTLTKADLEALGIAFYVDENGEIQKFGN